MTGCPPGQDSPVPRLGLPEWTWGVHSSSDSGTGEEVCSNVGVGILEEAAREIAEGL